MELTAATAKNVTRRAGRKALEPVKAKAIGLAPYGERDEIHLRDNIEISTKARRARRKSDVEVYMGVTVSLSSVGIQQEFGNINHGPQSFMRPAWDVAGRGVLTDLSKSMWAEIDKASARAARKAAREAAKLK